MSEEQLEQLAYKTDQALRIVPFGRTTLYGLMASGEIESFTVGRARFIPRQALIDFMNRRVSEQRATAD